MDTTDRASRSAPRNSRNVARASRNDESTTSTELARRESDGVEVTLWWNRTSGDLMVSVVDRNAGDVFDIPAGADEALDVFNHPYAYAHTRCVLHRGLAIAQAGEHWEAQAA